MDLGVDVSAGGDLGVDLGVDVTAEISLMTGEGQLRQWFILGGVQQKPSPIASLLS